ncbi:MAG: Spi family protease inhibitor, partial [Muribaculaceae bacterium]|nr:Spi family protease inhibitor [Muribaculaceae bacterium]
MKRFSLLFLSLFLLATALNAKQVDLADAQNIAMGYLTKNSPKHILGVSNNTPQLQLALEAKSKTNATDYFVFNNGSNNGYIIVAGDDRAVPVLGYSDEGSFDPSSMPDGLRYMLEVYASEMEYLRSNPNALAAEPSLARNPEVKPLLTCNWGQTDPFNRQCPT